MEDHDQSINFYKNTSDKWTKSLRGLFKFSDCDIGVIGRKSWGRLSEVLKKDLEYYERI